MGGTCAAPEPAPLPRPGRLVPKGAFFSAPRHPCCPRPRALWSLLPQPALSPVLERAAPLRPWPHPRLRLLSAVLAVEKGGRRLGWGGPRVGQERVARLAGRSGLGRGGQAVSLLCLRSGVGVPLGGCWLQGVSRRCPRDSQTGEAREPGLRAPSSQRQSGATLGLWPLWQRWPPR